MKKVITCLNAEYGRYVDTLRAIPWLDDALKPVERRVLLTTYEEAANKLTKCAKIVGATIGKYHPHGDASCYGTLVGLVNRGLIIGQGNFGAIGIHDSGPAAYRYTEAKGNPSVIGMFKDFLKFVPWQQLELEEEPLYLPSIIPIGLVGDGVIQGIGYNTVKIPRYNYFDLIRRLQSLLRNDPIKTQIIPSINNCNIFENDQGAFEKILIEGEGILQIVPKTEIASDKKSLYIYAKNPMNGFTKILNYCADYETTNGNPPFTMLDITSDNNLKVQIIPSNKQLVTPQFELEILKLISVRLHVKCNFVTRDMTVKQYGIDDVLLNSYKNYSECWLSKLKHDKSNLTHKLYELNIVLVIRDIINNNPTIKKVADILTVYNTNYKSIHGFQDNEISTICGKYTIKKLIETDIDIYDIQTEIQNIDNKINNHDQIVLDHVLAM